MSRSPNTWLSCFILLAGLASTGLPGGETTQSAEPYHITELVRQLGADDFNVREEASRQLLKIGLSARPALEAGVKDRDLEIRRRCRELIEAMRDADRQAKLAAFIADKEGKQKHDLPGWERYRKLAGEDAAARQFFVALLKADTDFLAEVEEVSARTSQRCGWQCQNVMNQQQDPNFLAKIAAVLLVSADPNVSIPLEYHHLFNNLWGHSDIRTEMRNKNSTPFKKIALAWMERHCGDPMTGQFIFTSIMNMQLKEGLDLALKAVRSKKIKGSALGHAVAVVGHLGGTEHVALLESFLEDKTGICGFGAAAGVGPGGKARQIQGQTEVRDVALAMLVRLTKQSFKEYGFAISAEGFDHLMSNPNFLGFTNNTERDKAFAKWKAWKVAQKK